MQFLDYKPIMYVGIKYINYCPKLNNLHFETYHNPTIFTR